MTPSEDAGLASCVVGSGLAAINGRALKELIAGSVRQVATRLGIASEAADPVGWAIVTFLVVESCHEEIDTGT
jgi:hypothetical protein